MSFRSSDQKSDPFDRARAPALDSVRVFVLEERGGGGGRWRRKGEGGRRPSKKKKKARRGSFRWKQKKGGRKKKKVSLAFLRREINKKKHIQRVRGTQILKDQREGDRRGSAKGGARSSVFFHFFYFRSRSASPAPARRFFCFRVSVSSSRTCLSPPSKRPVLSTDGCERDATVRSEVDWGRESRVSKEERKREKRARKKRSRETERKKKQKQ